MKKVRKNEKPVILTSNMTRKEWQKRLKEISSNIDFMTRMMAAK